MTDNNHPITLPPELVQQWANHSASVHRENGTYEHHELAIATQAARWGSNQELEACLDQIYKGVGLRLIPYGSHRELLCSDLRAARRPKPPSLKEQALQALAHLENGAHCSMDTTESAHYIRRALESLPD